MTKEILYYKNNPSLNEIKESAGDEWTRFETDFTAMAIKILQKESEGNRQEDTVAEWQNKNRNDKDDTRMADVQKQKK